MSEVEIAKITTHIEAIKADISELKDNNKEIVRAITKLAVFEDRFKGNDESHRIIWDKLNKTTEKFHEAEQSISIIKDWKYSVNKLWIMIIILIIAEIIRLLAK